MADSALTGTVFRELILSSQRYLSERKKEVDALNVFPVPDGDTGTNMYLTLSSAARYVEGKEDLPLCQVAEAASHGALMGARGNSGVILSQIFRGLSRYFSGKESVPPSELAGALDEAVSTAYKAVMKPVEGTILTVLRAMRDGAVEASGKRDLSEILEIALARGRETLARTPEMLPVLKQAGVVDAGGKGLVYVMEGALAGLSRRAFGKAPVPAAVAGPGAVRNVRIEELETAYIKFPYDAQLLVSGERISLSAVRASLEALGDSLLVVGSENLVRVHIHTSRPGDVLTACMSHGMLSGVTVDNMIEQSKQASETYLLSRDALAVEAEAPARAVGGPVMPAVKGPVPQVISPGLAKAVANETGVVSVATGEGMSEIMASLGCDLVIDGGSTMNPSTAELAEAVKTVGAKRIIFLPNNSNIFLAAKQAKKIVGRSMYIVPSKTVPQGISALLSLNLSEDMSHNLKRAAKAIKKVTTGEVTFAARDGRFGRHTMKQGDTLGLIDGKVEMVGSDPTEVLMSLVKRMVRGDDEIATVYCGKDVDEATRAAVLVSLKGMLGDGVEVEVHDGGQPLYYYIISVE